MQRPTVRLGVAAALTLALAAGISVGRLHVPQVSSQPLCGTRPGQRHAQSEGRTRLDAAVPTIVLWGILPIALQVGLLAWAGFVRPLGDATLVIHTLNVMTAFSLAAVAIAVWLVSAAARGREAVDRRVVRSCLGRFMASKSHQLNVLNVSMTVTGYALATVDRVQLPVIPVVGALAVMLVLGIAGLGVDMTARFKRKTAGPGSACTSAVTPTSTACSRISTPGYGLSERRARR